MNKFAQLALTALLALFFSIQFFLTIHGGFCWPFSSHRLFSQLPPKLKPIVQAVLQDADGNICIVHPGKVIPIEYSRCSGLIRNMCTSGTLSQKASLHEYLLKRINIKPWRAFDEMYSPVKSPNGAPFVTLRFETHIVEFQEAEYPQSKHIHQRIKIFP